MNTKIVLRATKGSDENIEKALLTLELNPETNKVTRITIEGDAVTDEFYVSLDDWKTADSFEFPASAVSEVFDLNATDSLVPEVYTLSDKDKEFVQRLQTEWIFIVLSTKLFKTYQNELSELHEKVQQLDKYSKEMWNDMKAFWSKVQAQINEKNLFKEHIHSLKNTVNELFERLKDLRSSEDAAFEAVSAEKEKTILSKLEPLEAKIKEGNFNFGTVFSSLKKVQSEFSKAKLTRATRSAIWKRIDEAFKAIKNNRSDSDVRDAENRLSRRIDGLKDAIRKMQNSINRDNKELKIQEDKLDGRHLGQIESQLREVKAKIIRERVASKASKLEDMHKTLADLEKKLAKMVSRREKEAAKKQKVTSENEQKEVVKAEEDEITETTTEATEEKESIADSEDAVTEEKNSEEEE